MTDEEVMKVIGRTADEACKSIKKLCDSLCIEHNSNYDFEDEEFKEIVENTRDSLCDSIRRMEKFAITYNKSYSKLRNAAESFCLVLESAKWGLWGMKDSEGLNE